MAEIYYPIGYHATRVTMRRLRELHEPKMHPLFAEPLFAWIESEEGKYGIGGGWRDTQPSLPGFAPDGLSFHQYQIFISMIRAYAAVDLVRANPIVGQPHLTMRWSDTDSAKAYGLHTFIKVPDEPWHMQPFNIRGHTSWVRAGRPDPILINYPGKPTNPIPPYQPGEPVVTTTTTTYDPPPRILDSRWWDEAGRFGDDMPNDDGVRHIPCQQAMGSGVAIVTLTIVSPKAGGFATLFKQGNTPPPNVSHINYGPALPAIANTTRIPVAADGSFKIYMSNNAHCVIDLVAIER